MYVLRTVLVLLASCGAQAAAAWDGATTFTASLPPADFTPGALSAPDAHGFWAAGTARDAPLLVHYDATGVPQFVRHVQGDLGHDDITIAALPDGGSIERDLEGYAPPHCVLRRYDANGNLRWTSGSARTDDPVSAVICRQPVVDAQGGIWVMSDGLQRIGNDGAVAARFAGDGTTVLRLVGDTLGSSVYAIGFVNGSQANSAAAVVEKISEHGAVLWKYIAPQSIGETRFITADADASGNLLAFGTVKLGSGSGVYGVKLSGDGALAWQHADTSASAAALDAVAATSDGNAYVLYTRPSPFALQLARTGSNGAFAWSIDTGLALCTSYLPDLRTAANGDALFADTCPDQNGMGQLALQRVSAAGTRAFSTLIAHAAPSFLEVLPDSTSVLIEAHPIIVDPNGNPVLDANGNPISGGPALLDHTAADGSALAAVRTTQLGTALSHSVSNTFGSDGSAYLLVAAPRSNQYELARIAPDGHVVWRTQVNDTVGSYYNELLIAGDAVCMVDAGDLHCYATANGASRGKAHLSDVVQPSNEHPFSRALDNGQLLALATDSGMHALLLDTNGTRLSDVLLHYSNYTDVSINGSGVSLAITGGTSYVAFDAHGAQRYSRTTDASSSLEQAYIASDGSGLLFGSSTDSTQVIGVDGSGTVRWKHTLTLPAPDADGDYSRAAIVQQRGDDVYILFALRGELYVEQAPHFAYTLQRISMSSGTIAWNTTVDGILLHTPVLRVSADGTRVLVVTDDTNRVHTQVLNAVDGATASERTEYCDADRCALDNAEVSSDGALRVLADASSDPNGDSQRVFVSAHPFASPPYIRLDQAGIDGAWFASYAAGQGFVIDYIAAARTVFMPWFTFGNSDSTDPAALTWYALQGTVPPGAATSVELAITAPDPGAFASGAVGVHAVGSATLRMDNCASGTLDYRFDPDTNGGAEGSITLTQLTASAPCMRADGSFTPGPLPLDGTNGFNPVQSGTWFDPAAAGQGLQISIMPPTSGFNGLVFAAWFTFDPGGHGDDAARQHWFTLQGDLAGASGGKVTLAILRTLGGTFDGTPTGDTVQVGYATLTLHACDAAQLDYQFDASSVAHAYAGLSGSINLSKIGGCGAN